jgi:zinc protease
MASGSRGSVIDSVRRLYRAGAVGALGEAQLLDRFLARGDEAAFEAILRRHGPMVLGVCRRILDDPHDVDDAFQATFLVLIKKARSIRDREVLGPWLYGVARRVAVRARVGARRRRAREQNGAEGVDVGADDRRDDRMEADEVRSLLDDELGRLPARYRAPLILCDLGGQTHEQAAAQLRCPVGTVKSRLSRGRERLRDRLVRRGLAPSAGLLASTIAASRAPAMPVELMDRTIAAARAIGAGRAIGAAAISAEVAALTKGVIRSMTLSQPKVFAVAALAIVLTAAGARALLARSPQQAPPTDRAAKPPSRAGAPPASPSPKPGRDDRGEAVASNTSSNEPGVVRFRLDNGLRVILRPIRTAKQTALVVVYSVGGDHDPAGRSGLGHMVEHVYVTAAAGAEKARTAEEFARRYPDGANAQTGTRYTVVSTVFPAKDLDEELRDAAARMGDVRVTADDLGRERPRLLEELANMYGRIPALGALNNARELIRPSADGGHDGGQPAHIRAITPEEVQAHWARYYKPRNAILALAGAVDPKAARRAIEAHFAKLAAGEAAPAPPKPGTPKFGEVRELTVNSILPGAGEPVACLAYVAPQPGDELYAPFLVLISRLWAGSAKLGGDPSFGAPVHFTPMDDPDIVAVSASARRGETAAKALARVEAFVAETVGPKLRDREAAAVGQELGFLLGTTDLPDEMLTQNPYGVAFSLARREQLGIDPAKLGRALEAVTDADLRRAAAEVFGPGRHAGVLVVPEN